MVAWVEELLRWAGDRRDLDPAHSPAARAWACHGQEVLRVERDGQAQLTITSGEVVEHVRGLLPAHALRHLQGAVRTRVQERLTGGADEAWFRAALRRFPRGIGLEEPALRAVPVRRRAADQPAAAGTVDVLGVDATGRVVAVEPALGADDTFVLRGLDDVAYLGHALATDQELGLRLGLPEQVELELAFCVGATGGRAALSKHARAQLAALAPDVRWHVQSVHGWAEGRPLGRRYPVGVVPESLG
jgi:hypothetical protein